jgi:single-stranded DNA-binding protein
MQQITLVGRAISEPVCTFYESGSVCAVVGIRLAGKPEIWGLDVWGLPYGEIAHKAIRKGTLVGVIGKVHIEPWTDGRGNTGKACVQVERLEIIAGPEKEEGKE